MPGIPFPPAWPAFGPVRVFPKSVHRGFGRLHRTVGHTLRVSAAPDPLHGRFRRGLTRHVPSVWGARRDDYGWDAGVGSRHDVAAFRDAAAVAAGVLVRYPLAAWGGLVPGTMETLMGSGSGLYLADYWVLILHHLVWTGALPYPARVRWVEGTGPGDERFNVVSELPTGVVEASREALILLEETALRSLDATGRSFPAEPAGVTTKAGLPVYRNGRWDLVAGRPPAGPASRPTATAPEPAGPPAEHRPLVADAPQALASAVPICIAAVDRSPEPTGEAVLRLDDQTFTARYGTASYRFPPRSKLLFTLLERVARRPGHRVDFDSLRAIGDVWDGSQVEDSTVRGAVARLRSALEDHGMSALAARIQTGTYRNGGYVLLDTQSESRSNS